MKLYWQATERKSGDSFEHMLNQFFFLLSDDSNLIRLGGLDLTPSTETIEVQVLNLLKEVKKAGANRDSVEIKVIADEKSEFAQKIVKEFERYKLTVKCKYLPVDPKFKLKINPQTLDIWMMPIKTAVQVTLQTRPKTRVLIIEDSAPVQKILNKVYSEIPDVEIVDTVPSIKMAVEVFHQKKPDFISLDMKLEDGTGLDFLKKIDFFSLVQKSKIRCALVTDCSSSDGALVFDAMALGVASYIQKPQVADLNDFARELSELLKELFSSDEKKLASKKESLQRPTDLSRYKLIAIGSSTGGTEVVRDLIAGFPLQFPPLVVVQHMPSIFTGLFAERIQKQTGRPTVEVKEMTKLENGHAYIASGNIHMVVEIHDRELFVRPKDGNLVNRFKPSVSVLFDSIFNCGMASKTVAIMLTGMGYDGAKEMLKLKQAGSLTIGQSKETCVVYGMPRAAAEIGALSWSASPQQMINIFNERKKAV